VGVPGPVAADLVMVQTGFVLRGLEHSSIAHRASATGSARDGGVRQASAAVERQLRIFARCRADLSANQQPVAPLGRQNVVFRGGVQGDDSPVVEPFTVRVIGHEVAYVAVGRIF
jgi:hypothetical protein